MKIYQVTLASTSYDDHSYTRNFLTKELADKYVELIKKVELRKLANKDWTETNPGYFALNVGSTRNIIRDEIDVAEEINLETFEELDGVKELLVKDDTKELLK